MRIFAGPSSGEKHDVTAQTIERIKGEIASIERTIEFLAAQRGESGT